MNPLIRIRVAQLLARQYNLTSEQAVNIAEELNKMLAKGGMDIVLATWVNDVGRPEAPRKKEDFWDGVSRRLENMEDDYGDWHPWRP